MEDHERSREAGEFAAPGPPLGMEEDDVRPDDSSVVDKGKGLAQPTPTNVLALDQAPTDGNISTQTPRDMPADASTAMAPSTTGVTADTSADQDTCRICRGEATPDEPLFYPCKCSGSIKHVHQDCLMEWLSHSQKKHCELCKTPFRFTKLYAPNMPKTLPPLVFVTHTTKYVARNMLVFARWSLVADVWLIWLPYLMRCVWAVLFWISDQGLGSKVVAGAPNNGTVLNSTITNSIDAGDAGNRTTSMLAYAIIDALFGWVVVSSDGTQAPLEFLDANTTSHPSLLGDVGFLRRLTPHRRVNNFVIAILEGQIITLLVIVCFVLIILVRDYVVQQQPEINNRAAMAAAEARAQAAQGLVDELEAQHARLEEQDEVMERQVRLLEDQAVLLNDPTDEAHARIRAVRGDLEESRQQLQETRREMAEARNVIRQAHEMIAALPDPDPEIDGLAGPEDNDVDDEAQEEGVPDPVPTQQDEGSSQTGDFDAITQTGSEATAVEPATASETSDSMAGRPRAATDGPVVNRSSNPLAHNSWSFDDDMMTAAEASDPSVGSSGSNQLEQPTAAEEQAIAATRTPGRQSHFQEHLDTAVEESSTSAGINTPQTDAPVTPLPETALPQVDGVPAIQVQEVGGVPVAAREPATITERVAHFMWRDVEAIDEAALPALPEMEDDFDEPLGFADLLDDAMDEPDEPEQQDDMLVLEGAEAADAAREREIIEDLEDLDGILELIGIRGPITGLFQNAVFCAFLVSLSIVLGIFLPYNIGKITLWAVVSPMRPVRLLLAAALVVQDTALAFVGVVCVIFTQLVQLTNSLLWPLSPPNEIAARWTGVAWNLMAGAFGRLIDGFWHDLRFISGNDIPSFSVSSHAALMEVKATSGSAFELIGSVLPVIKNSTITSLATSTSQQMRILMPVVQNLTIQAYHVLSHPSQWAIDLTPQDAIEPVVSQQVLWTISDRAWATMSGYLATIALSYLYLQHGRRVTAAYLGQEWDNVLMEVLSQASGVMKVILIISIEMLVFPLFCGMMLDVALLPLFENASITSRMTFTYNYPLTSMFVHWFIGTGYMFHFALFVSMCRKIMRKGVLYFIRDPDDPEFHPVRDVLERNVTTQLRKIMFSAVVYGGLVLVCLGGVVWSLAHIANGKLLPIHWSSNEPVLEFPLDLLFYNFLIPLAVKVFRPSHIFHTMYTWWFRKCARALRLTWFLFGERKIDEEGILQLDEKSSAAKLPWWRRQFLEVSGNEVVVKSWRDVLEGGNTKPTTLIEKDTMARLDAEKLALEVSHQLLPDGRYVRAPAADNIKLGKTRPVFVTVTENNEIPENATGPARDALYSSGSYQFTYVPPHFQARISTFVLLIWLFAAVTGVSCTIVPLALGRQLFRLLLPGHVRTNDIYAFSIGVYGLGSLAYVIAHAGGWYRKTKARLTEFVAVTKSNAPLQRAASALWRGAQLTYAYAFIFVIFPFMISALFELYLLLPLDTYLSHRAASEPPKAPTDARTQPQQHRLDHTVQLMQAWTIGIIYLKLITKIITYFAGHTRLGRAVRAVLRNGWLAPDLSILTRAFVIPCSILFTLAAALPPVLARAFIAYSGRILLQSDGALSVLVYRFSYPAAATSLLLLYLLSTLGGVYQSWKAQIRDEAYLIGERLHNLGAGSSNVAAAAGGKGAKEAWRAGNARIDGRH